MHEIFGIVELKEHDGFHSLFDCKTGHEIFRSKFPVDFDKDSIFAYMACISTAYNLLKVKCNLSGNELMLQFLELVKVTTPPSSDKSLILHIEGKGKSIDVDLN